MPWRRREPRRCAHACSGGPPVHCTSSSRGASVGGDALRASNPRTQWQDLFHLNSSCRDWLTRPAFNPARAPQVTHSAWLACAMRDTLQMAPQSNMAVRSLAIPNTAVNLVRWSGDAWQLVLWGDVGEFDLAQHVAGERRPLLICAVAIAGAGLLSVLAWRRPDAASASPLLRVVGRWADHVCKGVAATL